MEYVKLKVTGINTLSDVYVLTKGSEFYYIGTPTLQGYVKDISYDCASSSNILKNSETHKVITTKMDEKDLYNCKMYNDCSFMTLSANMSSDTYNRGIQHVFVND